MLNTLLQYSAQIQQLVYPIVCMACGNQLSKTEEIVCLNCQTSFPFTNYWNIRQNKMERHLYARFPFDYAMALFHFSKNSGVQHLLHELKYRGKTEVGIYLGQLLATKMKESQLPLPEVVVPLPLHWKKQKLRGYNQTDFIAEGIADVLGCSIDKMAVVRNRESESQTRKNKFDRIENVESIFELNAHHQLHGKSALLVDDVLTTGATIEACALALLKAPDIKLGIATIAVAD